MHQFRIQLGENLGYFDALFQSFSPELPYSKKRPLLVICPGGAYRFVSDREAEPVALAFSAHGYHTIVLRYPVAPVRYPAALCALAKTVAWAREHAVQYAIDPEAVSVLGFSAGGHLAACLGVFWNVAFLQELTGLSPEQIRPDKLLLAYPVITAGQYAHRESFQNLLGADADIAKQDALSIEKLVHEKMPSCFLWATETDATVPVENTLLLSCALREKHIPQELHIFSTGAHGLSLGTRLTEGANGCGICPACVPWLELACSWLERTGAVEQR